MILVYEMRSTLTLFFIGHQVQKHLRHVDSLLVGPLWNMMYE